MDRTTVDRDSEEWATYRNNRLLQMFSGDREALDFMLTISQITEKWDDMIDKDKPHDEPAINLAFYNALVVLPNNKFYVKHKDYLTPIIIQAINSWLDSNKLEKGTPSERALAYTLRNMDLQLVQAVVFLTGGLAALRLYSTAIWREFAAEQDDILEWINGDSK